MYKYSFVPIFLHKYSFIPLFIGLIFPSSNTKINSPTPNPSPLERGVNTLTYCWKTDIGCWRTGHRDPVLLWLAWQISVGRWPPCPVLQQSNKQPHPNPSPLERGVNTLTSCWRTDIRCWRTGHGGPVLLWLAWQISVGRWPPCPVLQQSNKLPHLQPLPDGEGSEYPHLLLENRYWVLENRAQRPCSTILGKQKGRLHEIYHPIQSAHYVFILYYFISSVSMSAQRHQ